MASYQSPSFNSCRFLPVSCCLLLNLWMNRLLWSLWIEHMRDLKQLKPNKQLFFTTHHYARSELIEATETTETIETKKRRLEIGFDMDMSGGGKKVRLSELNESVKLGESVRKVAEIVLVLATLGKMRGGGRKPSAVEVEMMVEAREKLVDVCKEFAPKDVFPRDGFGSVIEELGLSRLRDQKLGIGSPKLSIAERIQATKEKMENSEVFPIHSSVYTPPRLQSNLSKPAEIRGASNAVRMFPSDKANNAPISSGSFQNHSNTGTNSRNLPYQLPTSEVRPGISNTLPVSRADRPHFRIDGGANGSPYTSHSQGVGSDKTHVKTEVSYKPIITQTPNPVNVNQHRMSFVQPAVDTHNEICKLVQKVLHLHVLDHPAWTPPSRDYMNKALACQICKVIINEVDTALVCDACERGYHLKCLNCNPKALSRGEWQEWHCAKCLAISNGKPLPPKYGRVMRNINTPKLSSSTDTVQLSLEKKAMSSDVNTNGNSFSQTSSGGTASNDGKLTKTHLNENQEYGVGNVVDNRHLSNASELSSNGKKLEFGLNGVINEDGQDETVETGETLSVVCELDGPTSSSMNEVEWVGGVIKEIDGKKYYDSCCVNGVVYKVNDYAIFSSAGNRYMPNKLQAMWEDSKTTNKCVTVTRCFFPDDLPEGVGRPCAPESNEVYESNHETTLVAGLIHGACEVLPPSKFSEESDSQARLRPEANDRPNSIFLCKWFYDETKRSFRDVTC
ncbi:hypothetical protein QVD17_38599 [Tagetes erecta]|uniref:PHD finger protein n=1 Tax=Tagetes erecta TaxID=13708 RepID=A0AAD8JM60_TARER|nr:hypothetical protein QVD17_38599 [Tagetes erecta]